MAMHQECIIVHRCHPRHLLVSLMFILRVHDRVAIVLHRLHRQIYHHHHPNGFIKMRISILYQKEICLIFSCVLFVYFLSVMSFCFVYLSDIRTIVIHSVSFLTLKNSSSLSNLSYIVCLSVCLSVSAILLVRFEFVLIYLTASLLHVPLLYFQVM